MTEDKVERRAVEFVNGLEIAVEAPEEDGLLRVYLRLQPAALHQDFDKEALEKVRADAVVVASAQRMAREWVRWMMKRAPIRPGDGEVFEEKVVKELGERLINVIKESREMPDPAGDG